MGTLDASLTTSSTYPGNETSFANVFAFNEFDSRANGAGNAPEWRMKIDAQRGAVLGSEMKNNCNKLARWTTESLLNGVDQMRFGFVSRVSSKDRKKHCVLGTGVYKPLDMASHINLNVDNGWGIFKAVVDICFGMSDGKYVLVKDPNKPILKLYQVNQDQHDQVDQVDRDEQVVDK
jgi:translation initiation factor 3 subunit D